MYLIHKLFACSALLILTPVIGATDEQNPIQNQHVQQTPLQHIHSQYQKQHRIAIIGAGAGGASAAYHLSQFSNLSHLDIPIDITIYDINNRAGGRTTTVNALDDPRFPVEVGASIFVKVNHILYNASRDFELNTDSIKSASTGSHYEFGVWDGKDFVFTSRNDPDQDGSVSGRWRGWWDIAKLIWRYGLSPIKTNQLMKSTVGKFLKFYDEYFPFYSLDTATEAVGLDEFTGVTGADALSRGGISEEFARHVVQASTRVNYAQNLGTIHGLEAMVCMATDGAMAVEGGNWKMFDEFVRRSRAEARFGTAVTRVEKQKQGTFRVVTNDDDDEDGASVDKEFDSVILAAPYQYANVTFYPPVSTPPPKIDYVTLHVTLFTSPRLPSPSFFGLEGQSEVPDTILTTLSADSNVSDTARGKDAVGPTKFWSISTRVLETDDPSLGTQYLYKIFSPEPISFAFVGEMFDFAVSAGSHDSSDILGGKDDATDDDDADVEFQPISSAPLDLISWYHVKTWHSYPYLPPRTSFPPIRIDDHIYYTSAIEPFISTMETSALAGRNIAKLIVDQLEWDEWLRSNPQVCEDFSVCE